jgi:hypothetical protein
MTILIFMIINMLPKPKHVAQEVHNLVLLHSLFFKYGYLFISHGVLQFATIQSVVR